MTNTVSTTNPLFRLIELTNKALDGQRLQHIQKIVFILVLFNYWSKLYRKVLIGGPVRAAQDFKAYLLKVRKMTKRRKYLYCFRLPLNNCVDFLLYKRKSIKNYRVPWPLWKRTWWQKKPVVISTWSCPQKV
jgi:hypothetical protein